MPSRELDQEIASSTFKGVLNLGAISADEKDAF